MNMNNSKNPKIIWNPPTGDSENGSKVRSGRRIKSGLSKYLHKIWGDHFCCSDHSYPSIFKIVPALPVVFELSLIQLHAHIRCLEVQRNHLTSRIPKNLRKNIYEYSHNDQLYLGQKVAGIHPGTLRIDSAQLPLVVIDELKCTLLQQPKTRTFLHSCFFKFEVILVCLLPKMRTCESANRSVPPHRNLIFEQFKNIFPFFQLNLPENFTGCV